MRANGILILVGLIVGFAGGYLVRGEGEPAAPSPASTPDVGDDAPAPAVDTSMLDGAPVAVHTQPTLEPARGDGVIRGRVTDKAGEGVAGVLVVATPQILGPAGTPNPTRAPPPEASLEEQVADAVAGVRARHAGRQRVLTDASGAYALEKLAPGSYRIEAWKESYQFRAPRGSDAWRAKPGSVVDFEGESILLAYLDVIGADGQRPEQVNISSSTDEEGREGRRRFTWTPKRNWIQLSPGEHWLVADVRREEEKSAPVRVVVARGEEAPRLTLELVGRPGIRGVLILPEAMTPERASVSALRFDGQAPPAADAAIESRQRARGRYDRRDNSYEFRRIKPGRYLLLVSYDGRQVEHSLVVEVGNSVLELDIEMPPVSMSRYRVVRVFDEKDQPVRDVRFSLKVTGKYLQSGGPASTVAREDGSYYVARRPWVPQRAGQKQPDDETLMTRVELRVPGRGKVSRVVDPDAREDLVVRVGAPASVALLIEGFSGSPLKGKSRVYVKTDLDESGMGFEGEGVPVTDEGRASLGELSAGSYIAVLVSGKPGGMGTVQVEAWPLELDSGGNQRSVTLPTLYETTFVDAPASPMILRVSGGLTWTHQFLRQPTDGVYTAQLMPAGRYIARIRTRDRKERNVEFEVPSRGPISLGD